ncbi:hypothetical protein K9N68_24480 [Kovacikia minuta CCNUW1]|uniref:hypothetical protein n=1 Tax=Kovacikia minuta TaxID=2931930 RepID=UPI001CCBCD75|nr:hypothetical protein [Kovacikia minuta]UBF24791.1 hypothetical protein K9N68_24480 [Kovacikia minuta CCNUW1]
MLPLVIDEEKVFIFEFWFKDTLTQGMYCHNELFSKLRTFDIRQRSQVYRLACKLAQKDAFVVLTCTATTCSLWGSLRSSLIKEILLNPGSLKSPDPGFSPNPSDRQ